MKLEFAEFQFQFNHFKQTFLFYHLAIYDFTHHSSFSRLAITSIYFSKVYYFIK